jgi:hypothetical protein
MLSDKTSPEEVHVEHVQKRQYKYYNIMVIAAMSFASIGMGYSASIIGTTLGILKYFIHVQAISAFNKLCW